MQVISEIEGAPRPVTIVAQQAIVLYRPGSGFGEPATLAALHSIDTSVPGKPPVIGPGAPLDRRALDLMLRQVAGQKEARQRSMIPVELLFVDTGRMVWYVPAKRRPIFFRTGRKEFDQAMNAQEVLWPALLFVAEPGSLRLYALGGNDRPTAETPLFLAPIYNVHAISGMCAGTIRLPDAIDERDRATWEAAVFDTQFTHSNYGSVKYVKHPRGHEGLWRQMRARQEWRGFPESYLVPAVVKATDRVLTVGEVINQ